MLLGRRSLVIALSCALVACRASEGALPEEAFEAAYANDSATLARMLKLGISPDATNAHGESLLYVATGPKGGAAVVRTLLKAGADPNRGRGSYTPLMNASSWVNVEVVELLLLAGADPHRKNDSGETALETTGMAGGKESAVRERIKAAQKVPHTA